MTIINPNQYKKGIQFLVKLFILLLAGGLLYIYSYSYTVDKRHAIKDAKKSIVALEVENADLKNELYTIIDPSKLEDMAQDYNFVFENNPDYINLSQWISDSSY